MINRKDDRGSGEEERSEARTDFRGLGGADSEKTRGWEVRVRQHKLSKREREERVKRYRGDVRCDGSWAKDGSRVVDLSPLWLPSGCVSEYVCVF